ncbi:lysozyme [Burkholderia multivorans]|nr:lysozyme [Burkholderia multivorans]
MANVPKKTLAGVVGAAAAALLFSIVPKFEGLELVARADPIGIITACYGDTKNVRADQRFTPAECRARLEQRLIEHAEPVLKCTPVLKGHTYQLAAAVSFAYNVGAGAYCGSTTAKRFNAGDWKGACRAMNESDSGKQQWVTAGGRVLPGLVKRRAEERALCERGL